MPNRLFHDRILSQQDITNLAKLCLVRGFKRLSGSVEHPKIINFQGLNTLEDNKKQWHLLQEPGNIGIKSIDSHEALTIECKSTGVWCQTKAGIDKRKILSDLTAHLTETVSKKESVGKKS